MNLTTESPEPSVFISVSQMFTGSPHTLIRFWRSAIGCLLSITRGKATAGGNPKHLNFEKTESRLISQAAEI